MSLHPSFNICLISADLVGTTARNKQLLPLLDGLLDVRNILLGGLPDVRNVMLGGLPDVRNHDVNHDEALMKCAINPP